MPKCLAGGPNLTIEVLRRVLLQESRDGRVLPETLCLVLDNCAGENKNETVLAFAAFLVQAGVFQAVELCFLLVGHTHEVTSNSVIYRDLRSPISSDQDIDQVFSRVAMRLRSTPVRHLRDMARVICESQRNAQGYELEKVMDYKSPLRSQANRVTGHSQQQQFRFVAEADRVIMATKYRSTDKWTRIGAILSQPVTGMDTLSRLPRAPLHLTKIRQDLKHFVDHLHLSKDEVPTWKAIWEADLQHLQRQTERCATCTNLMEQRSACVVRQGDPRQVRAETRQRRARIDDKLKEHLQCPTHLEYVEMPPARCASTINSEMKQAVPAAEKPRRPKRPKIQERGYAKKRPRDDIKEKVGLTHSTNASA